VQSLLYVRDSVMEVAVLLSDVSVTMYKITTPSTYPFKVLSATVISYIAIIFVLQLISNIRKIP
jgi:ABC-type amino acid transport system permease subunit